jgi:AcrR family transcriptional regulator
VATTISQTAPDRLAARRRAVVDEALDHAEAIVAEQGAGAVTVSEIARRMGIRPPSLYKYFPSLHGIYDALVARGNARVMAYVTGAVAAAEPGLDRLLVAARAMARWGTVETGLAPLLFWRPVPGFEPSPEAFAPSQALWQQFRADLASAAREGQLAASADSDAAMRMLTVLIAGICSQQLANEPDAPFADGAFTTLTDPILEMFLGHFAPRKAAR